jgi:hypothetical protein
MAKIADRIETALALWRRAEPIRTLIISSGLADGDRPGVKRRKSQSQCRWTPLTPGHLHICDVGFVICCCVDIAVAFSTFQTGKEENAVATSGILRAMPQDIHPAFRREEALQQGHLQKGDGS